MFKTLFKSKYLVVIILLIIAIVLLIIGVLAWDNNRVENIGEVEESVEDLGWSTYTSQKYSFTLKFPRDWKVYEDLTDDLSPKVNIYKPVPGLDLPLTHFSDATHVSIFPKGLQTEGVIGERAQANLNISESTTESTNYLLQNGNAWGSFIIFSEPPASWKSWGFIWLGTKIDNLSYACSDGQNPVPVETCDPYSGNVLIRQGSVSEKDRRITEEILASFKFIK